MIGCPEGATFPPNGGRTVHRGMQRGQISLNRKFFSFGHCKTIYVAVSREFVKLIRLRQFSKAIQELQAARFRRQTLFRRPLGIEQPG
jgi:hypothetical protein